MSDAIQEDNKIKRDRSPSYPSIPLGAAAARLATLDEYFKRHPAPFKQIGLAWGMKPGSSQSSSTAAALKSFGLVDYQGSGDDLKVVLSDEGRTYLRAQQDEVKRAVLRRSVLKPKAIAKYWAQWGATRPPDPVCLDELILKAKFTQAGAETFLKVYDASIATAGLSDSDKVDPEDTSNDSSLDDDAEWLRLPPATGGAVLPAASQRGIKPMDAHLQDVFNVDDGQVIIQWPTTMTTDSFTDFVAWLEIVKRKIQRQVKATETQAAAVQTPASQSQDEIDRLAS